MPVQICDHIIFGAVFPHTFVNSLLVPLTTGIQFLEREISYFIFLSLFHMHKAISKSFYAYISAFISYVLTTLTLYKIQQES